MKASLRSTFIQAIRSLSGGSHPIYPMCHMTLILRLKNIGLIRCTINSVGLAHFGRGRLVSNVVGCAMVLTFFITPYIYEQRTTLTNLT